MAPRIVTAMAMASALMAASAYESEIETWRRARETALKADGGWLTVTGLIWLAPGANRFGRDSANNIVLPDGPEHAGSFELRQDKVTVAMDGVRREVKPDSADMVKVGRLSLFVIKRGERYGIRLKDPASEYRREFRGLEYFPAREEYRVKAQFVAAPRQIAVLNILGQTEPSECPGYAEFQLRGHRVRLYPIVEEPGARELFYIFRDQTSGKETYGAGRFLYSEFPQHGQVELDFNKAYNPPCAFTPYATCPLPPPENRLAVAVEAGEKKYGH